jgi:hypothetical protein
MNEALLNAYLETTFHVFEPSISIKVGHSNNSLEALLIENNASEWAYITPYNPYSRELNDIENLMRFERLKGELSEYSIFEGEGVGMDLTWAPERSLLILGITKEKAIEIGNNYEQNAIVYGAIHQLPELLVLREFES